MHLTLYKYQGERNKVNKQGDLIRVSDVTGTFKADISLLAPTLLLSLPAINANVLTDENGNEIADVVTGDIASVYDFNYVYIAEFNRYYYVNSIVVSSKNLLIVSCEVDALYSFRAQILDNYGMVERNEFEYNELLNDDSLPLKPMPIKEEYAPDEGSFVNTRFKSDFTDEDSPLIYAVTMGSTGGTPHVYEGVAGLNDVSTYQAGDVGGQAVYALNKYNVDLLLGVIMGQYSAYASFFKSLVAFPFAIDFDGANSGIYVYKLDEQGNYEFMDTGARGVTIPVISNYLIVADFVLPIPSSFMDLYPFTHYEIYLPFYGWYELNAKGYEGDRFIVYYSVNYDTGAGEVYLHDVTKNQLIFSAAVQVGIQLSLTSSNAQEINAQKAASQLNLILGLVGSGVGVIGSVATGNVLGAVGSGLSAVSSVTNYINQTSLMFQRLQSTHNGAGGALYSPMSVKIRVTRVAMLDGLDIAGYAHQFGRPLMQVRQLRALSGFTRLASIHLEGCTATDVEKQQITSSLLAGVIL